MKSAGLQMGGFGTSNASVKAALDLVEAELEGIRADGVTEGELAAAKTYLNGSFPLSLSSNDRIADILVAMQFSNLPTDYLDDRPKLIDAVTQEDIKRVAQKLLDPDKLIVVVAGQPENLEALGAGAQKN